MIKFLEKIRASDETVKRRWLIISSAIISAAVILVWLKYFGTLVQPASSDTQEPGTTLWQTMKIGTVTIYNLLVDQARNLIGILKEPKDYIIKP